MALCFARAAHRSTTFGPPLTQKRRGSVFRYQKTQIHTNGTMDLRVVSVCKRTAPQKQHGRVHVHIARVLICVRVQKTDSHYFSLARNPPSQVEVSLPLGNGRRIDRIRTRCRAHPDREGWANSNTSINYHCTRPPAGLAFRAFSAMPNALTVLTDPDAKRLWICVLPQQNTDPRRLLVRGGPISMDLCFARAKHRATELVIVFCGVGSWICGSVCLDRGRGGSQRSFCLIRRASRLRAC